MKLGCALPFDIFKDDMSDISVKICESFGGRDRLLAELGKTVDTVELRSVSIDASGADVYNASKICRDFGIGVTIHGKLAGAKTPEEFFAPYLKLFESGFQAFYNITVHPLAFKEETEDVLSKICLYAEKEAYPVRITLENQRLKNEHSVNGICESVSEIVEKINSPILKICFDFGHQLSNIRKFGNDSDIIEDKFLPLVRHTHIHSLFEGTTHFPLSCGETLLDENLTGLLRVGYDGVLSLELDAKRYEEKMDIKNSFVHSVAILKAAAYQAEEKNKTFSEYENNYGRHLENIKNAMEGSSLGMGLLGPSAYVIKMGNKKIAVDVSIRKFHGDMKKREELAKLLSGFDAFIITHSHFDHYDRELLSVIPSDVKLFIPDFIPYEGENRIEVYPGLEMELGDVKLKFFNSLHSRPQNNVPEYGFAVEYNSAHYVFPTDVRTYDGDKYPKYPNVKALIAHLWLFEGLNLYDNRYIEEFCEFTQSFGAENTYVGHLYDCRRRIESMWTKLHYDAVKDKLINPRMLKMGDWIEF